MSGEVGRDTGEDGPRAIAGLLPRRYPFPLLDEVLEADAGHLVGVTVVARAEAQFRGHFPGRPLLPGVLVCEALAQAGAVLARRRGDLPAGMRLALAGVDRMRFRRAVVPADELRLHVALIEHRGRAWRFRAEAWVGGALAADGEIRTRERELPA